MRHRFLCLPFLALVMLLHADEINLVVNGSFEEGKPGATVILPGWVRRTAGNSFGFHSIATDVALEGTRSARIAIPAGASNGSGYFSSQNEMPITADREYRLSFQARCPKGKGTVFIIPYGADKRTGPYSLYGKINLENGDEWRGYELVYKVPAKGPAIVAVKLQLSLDGEGEVWYDAVRFTAVQPAGAANPTAAPEPKKMVPVTGKGNLIANGSFEEGKPGASVILPGWVRRTAGNSFGFHSIVSNGAADGKRCARIAIPKDAAPNSTGYFSASGIHVEKGKCYRLSFQARCPEGKAVAQLVLHDHNNRYLGLGGIKSVQVENGSDWKSFSCEYYTPDKAAEGYILKLQLELNGAGEVFFDDVRLEEVVPAEVKTEFYPSSLNYGRKLVGIANEPTPLIFYFFTTANPAGFTLELEAPKGFKPVFAGVVYAVQTPQVPIEAVPGAGEGRQRYRLVLPPVVMLPMKRYASDLFSGLALLFEGEAASGEQLKWELFQGEKKKADGGFFELEMLQSASGKLPKAPLLSSWYEPYLNYLRDEPLLKRYLDKLTRSGVRAAGISENPDKAIFNGAGFVNQRGFWMQPPNNCLTELLDNPVTAQRQESMARRLVGWQNATLCWNYEPGWPEYYHFCPKCQESFRAFAKLPPDAVLSGNGREMEAKYPKEYLKYRCWQQARIVSRFADICRKHGIRSGLNGYRVSRDTDLRQLMKQAGDVAELAKMVDVYQAQIYSLPEIFWPRVSDMLAFHPGTAITCTTDERGKGGTFSYSLLTPELIESEVMIAGLFRVKQLVLFVGFHTLDGAQIVAMRRALDRLAAREEMLDGEAKDLESAGSVNVHWREFRRDGKALLAVVNCDSSRKQWSAVPLPKGKKAFDPERKSICLPDEKNRLAVRLAPCQTRFFEIVDEQPASVLNVEEPAAPDAARQARSHFSQAGWKVDEDGNGVVSVLGPSGVFWRIDRAQGAVLHGKNVYAGTSGGLFRDLFRLPREAAWAPDCRGMYELTGVGKTAAGISVGFRRNLEHRCLKGLELLKTYRFSSGDVVVSVTIRNIGNSPMKVAFWQHNRPMFAGLPVAFSNGSSKALVSKTSLDNTYLDNPDKSSTLQAGERFRFTMSVPPEKFYFWKGENQPVSCEMFFPEITLRPQATWQMETILRSLP